MAPFSPSSEPLGLRVGRLKAQNQVQINSRTPTKGTDEVKVAPMRSLGRCPGTRSSAGALAAAYKIAHASRIWHVGSSRWLHSHLQVRLLDFVLSS